MTKSLEQSEEALREAKEKFQSLVELSSDWIWAVDTNGVFTYTSPKIKEWLGYEPDEVIGKTPFDLMAPEESSRVGKLFVEISREQKSFTSLENSKLHKDGHIVVLETSGVPTFDREGKYSGYRGVNRDISERKKNAEQQEARLRQLQQLSEISLSLTGEPSAVFEHVVKMIGELFQVPVVCLSEISGSELKFKAAYINGEVQTDTGSCPLDITPCSTVEETKDFRVYEQVQQLFPEAAFLRSYNAHTYCGFPSLDSKGKVMAVTSLLDDKPHEFGEEDRHILQLIGQRVAVEMERAEVIAEREQAKEFTDTALDTQLDTFFLFELATGKAIRWNRAFREVSGYSDEEISRMPAPASYYSPEDLERASVFIQNTLKEGAGTIELELICKDGRKVPTEYVVSIIKDDGGEPKHMISIGRDITERRRIQETLAESERLLNEAQVIANTGHWKLDIQTNDVSGSNELFRMFGLERSENTLNAFVSVIHPDDREFVLMHVQRGIEHGEKWNIEYRLLLKDGAIKHVNAIGRAIADDNGKTLMLIGTVQDISNRKQIELDLAKKESEINTIFEHAPVIAFYKDSGGKFLRVNRVYAEALHMPEDDFIGKTVFDLYSPKIAQVMADDDTEVMESRQSKLGIIEEHESEAGKRWVQTDKIPTFDSNGEITGLVGFAMDITEQKCAEEQLRQAQKMEAVGTLVGGIAHDFNNMLAAIKGNIYLAKPKLKEQPEVMGRLENIDLVATRAAEMVKQLLAFARKDTTTTSIFSLSDFMQEGGRMAKAMIPENIDYQINICSEKLNVRGDATQLHQVLLNLLNNARDAVADVPNPSISCNLMPYTADKAFRNKHPELQQDAFACWMIKDNGYGIPEASLEKIFEPFFTTKEIGKGTGLGLAMAFGAIKGHGGVIEVKSEKGKGTTFRIYLPVSGKDMDTVIDNPNVQVQVQGRGETILLVDDENDVRSTSRSVLENLGYKVLEAVDGEDALQVFKANRDDIALLMTDVIMPKLNGTELVMRAREINKDMPAILATGYDRDQVLDNRLKLERCDVINKPFHFDELSQRIRKLLDSE